MRHPRISLLLIFAFLAGAGVAGAQLPDPYVSTNDGDLMLGNARGYPPGALANVRPALLDGYRLTLLSASGIPIYGRQVRIHFEETGVRVHAGQPPGQGADCDLNIISRYTNAIGQVSFMPAVVGENTSPVPNVEIYCEGILMQTVRCPSVDLVAGPPGSPSRVDVFDLGEFRKRLFELDGHLRSDPECDYASEDASAGVVNVFDLNLFRYEFLCGLMGGGAPEPCWQTTCP